MSADTLVGGRTGMIAAVLFAAVWLGITGAQTPTMATAIGPSELAKLAAAGGLDALQQMLDARSPGLRLPGALTQTKARRVASLREAFGRKERVLSTGRGPRKSVSPDEPVLVDGGELIPPAGPTASPAGEISVASLLPTPPTGRLFPIPGGITPPITGGGGGSVPVVLPTPTATPPPATTPVPEPMTWLTLLIGFFAIGVCLRNAASRRRRA